MSKIQEIREALATGPRPFADLHNTIGGDDRALLSLLYFYRGKGEIRIGDDEAKTITLAKSGGGSAATGKSSKPAARKEKRMKPARKARPARKAKRPFKPLADKHANRATPNGAALHALALDNLVNAGTFLREIIGEIEFSPQPESLARAIQFYDNAAQLHEAAKQA